MVRRTLSDDLRAALKTKVFREAALAAAALRSAAAALRSVAVGVSVRGEG